MFYDCYTKQIILGTVFEKAQGMNKFWVQLIDFSWFHKLSKMKRPTEVF